MVIEVKQTLTEVFQSLKKGILDWIPNEIMELQKKFWVHEHTDNINIVTMSLSQLIGLISLIQKAEEEHQSTYIRPDCLDAFLRYIKYINGGQISDSGLCVMTTEFFNELVNEKSLTEETLIEKLKNSYHKTISLYFDGGKPNVVKGLFKQSWVNENKLKFVVC